ncbi:hypothetical protein ASG67_03275 [Sphingomonas sp. Leaf339]|uniref:hypothetical protein n=1 Tax=Sphingomonas sp. Leaf339 TaxID=1736343 RepID=UPI0006F9C364|nr:hypothetical protein [Sphingomonas sp. Leaf339]KQU62159.1 hypothetical protein ASG67_03275 [Sphingomonas sp. Leaf339]
MRTAIFLTASAIIFTAATPVSAAEGEQSFQHEGYTYVYKTSDDNGRKVISGHRLPGNAPFRLVVKDGRVTGTSGNTNVAFRTSEARGAAGGMAAIGR